MVLSMKRYPVLALCLMGCMGRASLGDQGTSSDPLSSAPVPDSGASPLDDAGSPPSSTEDAGRPFLSTDVEYVEVDTAFGTFVSPMRIDASCRVTDAAGFDGPGDPARCGDLFAAAADPTSYGCGPICVPNTCTGTVRVHLRDGRDFVRDLHADRCSVAIPGLMTEKMAWAVWYSTHDGG
ncbi:MAG: hypothetical protein K0S65_707 [Labilithrix sp.]|nr:hypothetical protein [Labilithrix sp.]